MCETTETLETTRKMQDRTRIEVRRTLRRTLHLSALLASLSPGGLAAQVDYFNLDDERPVVIEDALPVERYAFDLQLAPARVERERGGPTAWSLSPELAYGVLPSTDVSVHLPLTLRQGEDGGEDDSGVSGLEIGLFRALNVETLTLPALAVSGTLALPVGGLAHESTLGTLKAIATRSLGGPRRGVRFHANAAYTFGNELEAGDETEAVRWRAGVAADKTFVFESFLIVGDVYADRPLVEDAGMRWVAGAGLRYQLTPRMAIYAGLERRIGEDGPDWAFTFGTANAFSLRSLIPIGGS